MGTHTRHILLLTTSCMAVLLCPAPTPGQHLVKDGRSSYHIVLNSDASPSEKFAAQELHDHFEACTGVDLTVVTERPTDDAPMVVLGCGPTAESLGVKPSPAELGEQGYVLRTVGNHVVIAGTPAAGTLYGVYGFLETCLGVRWYAPGVMRTPKVTELTLPALDRVTKPAFRWRNISYTRPGRNAAFLARSRDNSGGGGPDHSYGVQYAFDGKCHSYFRYISPRTSFDEHPEYFSEIGGNRLQHDTQLCLTNPDVLEIVTEKMLERMASMPGVRQHNFSQMDWYNYCECADCRKMNEQYGTTGATQFWFVNELAKRTSAVYPDKLVGTLAYTFTEEPPKGMEMHPNAAVWLCHMYPSCQSHPIATCPRNADYRRRALAWSKLCSHLYIWHYVVDFAHYYNPYPNFRAMAADTRFYDEIGVEGIFLQAMGHRGGGGEFSELRAYYGMKLLWNPHQDADALLQDFLEGYYGAAAEPMWQYITMIHDKVQDDNVHMHLYTNPAQGYLPDEMIARAQKLFDQAEELVQDDEELLERVRVARMPLTYARIFPRNGYKLDDRVLRFQGDIASMSDTAAFLQRMGKHRFETIREWGGDPQQLTMWTMAGNTPLPYAHIENAHLAVDVLPLFGGRAVRIVDRQSGQCVTSYNVPNNLFFPFAGGEETRVGTALQAPAGTSLAAFTIVDKSDRSLTLQAKSLGIQVRRILTLASDKPVLTMTNVFTNPTDKPSSLLARSHLELELGDLMETRVSFTNRDGKTIERTMEPIVAGLRQGEFYRDQHTPNGSWTFTGSKGLQVTQSFDPQQIDFTWLYAYPADLNELEVEVSAKSVTLQPGEEMTFSHSLDVRQLAE
jgi:uncharacterized protein DUF4838/glycosyl hydrolase family 67